MDNTSQRVALLALSDVSARPETFRAIAPKLCKEGTFALAYPLSPQFDEGIGDRRGRKWSILHNFGAYRNIGYWT
jgi:hypothetical protein